MTIKKVKGKQSASSSINELMAGHPAPKPKAKPVPVQVKRNKK